MNDSLPGFDQNDYPDRDESLIGCEDFHPANACIDLYYCEEHPRELAVYVDNNLQIGNTGLDNAIELAISAKREVSDEILEYALRCGYHYRSAALLYLSAIKNPPISVLPLIFEIVLQDIANYNSRKDPQEKMLSSIQALMRYKKTDVLQFLTKLATEEVIEGDLYLSLKIKGFLEENKEDGN